MKRKEYKLEKELMKAEISEGTERKALQYFQGVSLPGIINSADTYLFQNTFCL